MSFANILGHTLLTIVGGIGHLNVGHADHRTLNELGIDPSAGPHKRVAAYRMGEAGVGAATRFGVGR